MIIVRLLDAAENSGFSRHGASPPLRSTTLYVRQMSPFDCRYLRTLCCDTFDTSDSKCLLLQTWHALSRVPHYAYSLTFSVRSRRIALAGG